MQMFGCADRDWFRPKNNSLAFDSSDVLTRPQVFRLRNCQQPQSRDDTLVMRLRGDPVTGRDVSLSAPVSIRHSFPGLLICPPKGKLVTLVFFKAGFQG
jgi:hypothetical protein